jgi:hypothetical protein
MGVKCDLVWCFRFGSQQGTLYTKDSKALVGKVFRVIARVLPASLIAITAISGIFDTI